jgi:tetratricopeptide (TPR) repeat protein
MKKPNKKQIIFASIVVAVAGVSAAAAILLSQYQTSIAPDTDGPKKVIEEPYPAVEKKADEAIKQAYEGDVAGGAALLDKAAEDTNDTNEKYIFYTRKATLLYNSGDVANALTAAIKAYEFNKMSDSAALVGQFSRESGNLPQAITYYKKAIELIDKTDIYWDEDTKYYGRLVDQMERELANG